MEAVVAYLDERRPRAARARARAATPASTTSRATRQATARRSLLGVSEPCRRQVVEQLVELRRSAGDYLRARRARRRGRALLRRAERRAWSTTPRSTTARCSATAVVLEPARPPHGRHARRAASRTSTRTAARRGSSSGRTTRTSATRARPRWAARGELNVGQLVRERHGRRRRAGRLHHLRRHGHRRLRLGRRRPSASASARRCPAATRRCSTTPAIPRVPALPAGRRRRSAAGAARAAAGAGDRRDLPARDRAREPLLHRAASPDQFDASSTSTRRAPSSRSSARRHGSAARCPRPTRQRSEPRFTSPHRRRRIPRHGSRPQGGVGSAAHHRRRNPSWFPRVRDMYGGVQRLRADVRAETPA